MKTDVTFLSSSMRLAKTFSLEGNQTYPLARTFTSHRYTFEISDTGLEQFEEALRMHANKGDCLYKGNLAQPLNRESRAGKTDTMAKTQLLVIDVDGFEMESAMPDMPWNQTSLEQLASTVVGKLPECFNGVSYIAQASASMGMKGERVVSMHLLFFLDKPVNPGQLKLWLTQLNLDNSAFSEQVELAPSGMHLRYPIDRCMAENSRIVYIAPPVIKPPLRDPFDDGSDNCFDNRIVRHQGRQPFVEASGKITNVNAEHITQAADTRLAELRKHKGLKAKKVKSSTIKTGDHSRTEVILNPDRASADLSYVKEPFAYINLNGGDSNAYYFRLDNPRWVHNFKGEPSFELEKVDPEFFRWAIEEFQQYLKKDSRVSPLVFRDFDTDAHYTVEFDSQTGEVMRSAIAARASLKDFMEEHFEPMPDPIESWVVRFQPQGKAGIDRENKFFNLFTPPRLMLAKDLDEEHCGVTYGYAMDHLDKLCPGISKLIWHVLGDGRKEYEHFINWLAYVFTEREKTSVAWMLQGIEGTGKGILFNRVVTPMFSERYSVMKRMSDIEDNFDGWREYNLITAIDEFKLADSKSMHRTYNQIKNLISEPTGTVRYMRTNPKQVKLHSNYLFFTNNEDAMRLADGDRRFCVGNRQEMKLGTVTDVPQLLNAIDEEIETFAAFLNNFDADSSLARTALENEAKSAMRVASSTWVDDFARSLSQGNIDFFIENVLINAPEDAMAQVQFNKVAAVVVSWMHEAYAKGVSLLPAVEARTVYCFMNGAEMGMPSFIKTMARHAVDFSESSNQKGKRGKRTGSPAMTVKWQHTEYDLAYLLNEHLDKHDTRRQDLPQ